MGVKEQMISILRDRDTARISFTYRYKGVTAAITPETFKRVASGIQSGHFSVVEGRHNGNMLTYSSWKYGDDDANTFYLGQNQRWSRDFNALVVHESVHAYFDLTKTEINWHHNEAVAFIAQGYYLRNSGYPVARMEEDEPYEIGYQVAIRLARGQDASDYYKALYDKLEVDSRYSSYIHNSYKGDG